MSIPEKNLSATKLQADTVKAQAKIDQLFVELIRHNVEQTLGVSRVPVFQIVISTAVAVSVVVAATKMFL